MCYLQISHFLAEDYFLPDLSLKLLNIETAKVLMILFFCLELYQALLKGEIYKSKEPYSKFMRIFQKILQKNALLKSEQVRGNHTPFVNK